MNFSIDFVQGMSQEVREWVTYLENRKAVREQKFQTALESLSLAVLETGKYINQVGKKGKINGQFEKERELGELWQKAAMDIRTVNPELAERCFLKAGYWTYPASLDETAIQQYDITLESMSKAVRGFVK